MAGALQRHLSAALASLLTLAVVQTALETLAIAWVYAGQIVPPYGFFPTQLYDFLAKIRHAGGPVLGFLPTLPDSFLPPSFSGHLSLFMPLLTANLATALVLALLAGTLGGLAVPGRRPSVRAYLWSWLVIAAVVHGAVFFEGLSLDQSPSMKHIIYRSRSFILDGTIIAALVLISSAAIVYALAKSFERASRTAPAAATAAGAAVIIALAGAASLSPLAASTGPASASADSAGMRPETADRPVNVILISLDSLRADHVGCYGYERDTTPTLDRLAKQGIRFADAHSTSSWTLPTHLTMFTSLYQLAHGVTVDTMTLDPLIPTLGTVFEKEGYATAGFVSAPYTAATYGYNRGMDVYEDLSEAYGHRDEARSAVVAPEITKRGIEWMEKHAGEPFFMFLHYFDIHYDYTSPPPFDTMFDPHYDGPMDGRYFIESKAIHPGMPERDLEHILALYDGEIRFTDGYVAKVLDALDRLELVDNTLVMVVSDHGDEFFEHRNKGHHRSLYDEVLAVPFIVRMPGGKHAGTVVDEPVTLIDIAPTLIDAAGLERPAGMAGVSLLPAIAGDSSVLEGRPIYSEFFDKRGFNLQVARRLSDRKLIQHFNRLLHPRSPSVELFDLASDPGERNNVAEQDSDAVRAGLTEMAGWLEEEWRAYRAIQAASVGGATLHHDQAMTERLRSLGYADSE